MPCLVDQGTHRTGAENADRTCGGWSVDAFDFIPYVVVIIAVALLPETRGKQLAVYD